LGLNLIQKKTMGIFISDMEQEERRLERIDNIILIIFISSQIIGLGLMAYSVDLPNKDLTINMLILSVFILALGNLTTVSLMYYLYRKKGYDLK